MLGGFDLWTHYGVVLASQCWVDGMWSNSVCTPVALLLVAFMEDMTDSKTFVHSQFLSSQNMKRAFFIVRCCRSMSLEHVAARGNVALVWSTSARTNSYTPPLWRESRGQKTRIVVFPGDGWKNCTAPEWRRLHGLLRKVEPWGYVVFPSRRAS